MWKQSLAPSALRRAAPYLPLLRPHFVIHVSKVYDSRMHRSKRQRLYAQPSWQLARLDLSRLRLPCVKPKVVAICYNVHRLVRTQSFRAHVCQMLLFVCARRWESGFTPRYLGQNYVQSRYVMWLQLVRCQIDKPVQGKPLRTRRV